MKSVVASVPISYLAFALISGCASADARAVEVAPFTGFRFGGSFENAGTSSSFTLGNSAARGLLLDSIRNRTSKSKFC